MPGVCATASAGHGGRRSRAAICSSSSKCSCWRRLQRLLPRGGQSFSKTRAAPRSSGRAVSAPLLLSRRPGRVGEHFEGKCESGRGSGTTSSGRFSKKTFPAGEPKKAQSLNSKPWRTTQGRKRAQRRQTGRLVIRRLRHIPEANAKRAEK